MISVIIPNYGDDTYLMRCINSVKRQTYKKVEIILILRENERITDDVSKGIKIVKTDKEEKYAGINLALRKAKGEFVLFCNKESVLAPKTLEQLFEHAKTKGEEEVFTYGNCYIPDIKGYKQFKDVGLSYEGKLFRTDIIRNKKISFDENAVMAEYLFNASYLKGYREIVEDNDICIYNMGTEFLDIGLYENITEVEWKAIFSALRKVKQDIQKYYVQVWKKYIEKNKIFSSEAMFCAAEQIPSAYEINYLLSKPLLIQWKTKLVDHGDEESTELLRKYLMMWEQDKGFFEILLEISGLDEKQYLILKNGNAELAMLSLREARRTEDNNNFSTVLQEEIRQLRNNIQIIGRELDIDLNSLKDTNRRILEGFQPGLVKIGHVWYYYNKGEIDRSFRGLAQNPYGWWYVVNGKIDDTYSGLADNIYGKWYVNNGKIDTKVNGYRILGGKGLWLNHGKVDTSKSGLYKIEEKWYYFNHGIEDKEFKGLIKNDYGWWYVENGTINYDFKGRAENQYGWWDIENGTIKKASLEEENLNDEGEKNLKVESEYTEEMMMKACQQGKIGLRGIVKLIRMYVSYKINKG